MGTKFKIEEYLNEVLNCLDYLSEALNNDNDQFIMNSKQLKLDFFMMLDNRLDVLLCYCKVVLYLGCVIWVL